MTKIYRKIYRDDVKAIGADAAYFLAELEAREKFCIERGMVTEDGFFELSVPMLEEYTGFDRFKQERIIAKMIECGFLEKRVEKCTRYFHLQPVQNTRVQPVQNTRVTRAKYTGKGSKMHGLPVQSTRVASYISDNRVINSVNNSCDTHARTREADAPQQTIEDLIRDYFVKKNQPAEAAKFIQYNRDNYGTDHLTPDNYKKLADLWLKAKRPEKKKKGGRYKTAQEAAEAQGMTVVEFLGAGGVLKVDEVRTEEKGVVVTTHPDNVDTVFDVVFGGVESGKAN